MFKEINARKRALYELRMHKWEEERLQKQILFDVSDYVHVFRNYFVGDTTRWNSVVDKVIDATASFEDEEFTAQEYDKICEAHHVCDVDGTFAIDIRDLVRLTQGRNNEEYVGFISVKDQKKLIERVSNELLTGNLSQPILKAELRAEGGLTEIVQKMTEMLKQQELKILGDS